MRRLTTILLFISLLLQTSCARYRIGDEIFSSPADALHKQNDISSRILNSISPTDNPAHGTALYLFPSEAETQRNHIKYSGDSSSISKEQNDFILTAITNYFKFIAEAIRKKGIFDNVSVERHNGNPTSYPVGEFDFIIFVDVDGLFIKARDNPKPLPITPDKSKPAGDVRFLSLLESLDQQAHVLRGK